MSLSRPARKQTSPCMCCPRKNPNIMAVWSAPTAPVAMSSTLIEEGPLTVAAINQKLAEYQTHYNTYRPHDGIGLLTPMEYYQQLTQAA